MLIKQLIPSQAMKWSESTTVLTKKVPVLFRYHIISHLVTAPLILDLVTFTSYF